MKIIKPSVELEAITAPAHTYQMEGNKPIIFLDGSDRDGVFNTSCVEKVIEKAGRTCYKSEDKITEDSSANFCKMIQTKNHLSVLEHCSATFRIITSRDILQEIVRHRLASYSVESTRYVNYNKKGGIQFILPWWCPEEIVGEYETCYDEDNGVSIMFDDDEEGNKEKTIDKYWYNSDNGEAVRSDVAEWFSSIASAECNYNNLIKNLGQTPQQARSVLPGATKTEIVMTANFREWLHFLSLRTSQQAHPDIQIIAKKIGNILHAVSPNIFSETYE